MPRRKHEEPEQDDLIANEALPGERLHLDEESAAVADAPEVTPLETRPGVVEVHLLDRDRVSSATVYIETHSYRITVDGVNYHHVDTIGGRNAIWRYAPED